MLIQGTSAASEVRGCLQVTNTPRSQKPGERRERINRPPAAKLLYTSALSSTELPALRQDSAQYPLQLFFLRRKKKKHFVFCSLLSAIIWRLSLLAERLGGCQPSRGVSVYRAAFSKPHDHQNSYKMKKAVSCTALDHQHREDIQQHSIQQQPAHDIEHLQCTICYDVRDGAIYQCREGHLICTECLDAYHQHDKKNCPSCKVPMVCQPGQLPLILALSLPRQTATDSLSAQEHLVCI